MGTDGWCKVACVSEIAGVCGGVGVTEVRITHMEHVWLLCGTEINSCRCSKWHDNQSPPRHHLPPLCQFVTVHSSVVVPSFNIEQEHNSGKNTRKKQKERENKGTDKECSPWGEQWERSPEVYHRVKIRNRRRWCPGDWAGSGSNHIPVTPRVQIWTATWCHIYPLCQSFPLWAFYG